MISTDDAQLARKVKDLCDELPFPTGVAGVHDGERAVGRLPEVDVDPIDAGTEGVLERALRRLVARVDPEPAVHRESHRRGVTQFTRERNTHA